MLCYEFVFFFRAEFIGVNKTLKLRQNLVFTEFIKV